MRAPSPRPDARRIGALVLGSMLLAVSACTTGGPSVADGASESPRPSPSIDQPRSMPHTTSSPTPSVRVRPAPSGDPGPGPDGVTITTPPPGVPADGPIVVLVHGGGWVAGTPSLMNHWADALAAEGAVVFNASYRLVGTPGGGEPGSVDDVACAVRFARAEAPAYTDSDELVVVGHSAGGHLGAVVSLDPAPWAGDCAYPPAAPPDRFVGLAGVYDIKAIPFLFILAAFVGESTSEAPERWAAVDPVEIANRPDLDVVLVTGAEDDLVPSSQARAFADALPGGAQVVEVPGAGHNDVLDPTRVGLDVVLQK